MAEAAEVHLAEAEAVEEERVEVHLEGQEVLLAGVHPEGQEVLLAEVRPADQEVLWAEVHPARQEVHLAEVRPADQEVLLEEVHLAVPVDPLAEVITKECLEAGVNLEVHLEFREESIWAEGRAAAT